MKSDSTIRLNIGCGGRPLVGYINVDMDTLDQLKKRYPGHSFPDNVEVRQYDILHLPYDANTVDEVRADAFVEHLSFKEEALFFKEIQRVLKPGGRFEFSVPDFEAVVKMWIEAKDDWRDFYRDDDEAIREQHWFGQYSYSTDSRWGYITAMIFGSQNGEGQYHRNAYSAGKIRAMLNKLDFDLVEMTTFRWKEDRDPMIRTLARKK